MYWLIESSDPKALLGTTANLLAFAVLSKPHLPLYTEWTQKVAKKEMQQELNEIRRTNLLLTQIL